MFVRAMMARGCGPGKVPGPAARTRGSGPRTVGPPGRSLQPGPAPSVSRNPMSARIDAAERLKAEWTDRKVVVAADDPKLSRFAGRIGVVRTVNMNGNALVEFLGWPDISWYDIAPTALREATGEELAAAEPKPVKKTAAAPKPAMKEPVAAPTEKLSPLELARRQDGEATAPAPARKLSPLEQAKMQDAGGDVPAVPAQPTERTVSPLEMARMQDAGGDTPPVAAAPEGKKLSPLEMARMQDAGDDAPATEGAAEPATSDALPPAGPARTAAIIALARAQGGPS